MQTGYKEESCTNVCVCACVCVCVHVLCVCICVCVVCGPVFMHAYFVCDVCMSVF